MYLQSKKNIIESYKNNTIGREEYNTEITEIQNTIDERFILFSEFFSS
jgi:hypothetical protein